MRKNTAQWNDVIINLLWQAYREIGKDEVMKIFMGLPKVIGDIATDHYTKLDTNEREEKEA